MDWVKIVLDWFSSTAWPLSVLLIVFLFRRELRSLVENISGVVERARKERVEIALGEKFKVLFGETVRKVEAEVSRLGPPGGPPGSGPPDAGALTGDDRPPPSASPPPSRPSTPLPPNYYRERLYRLVDVSPRAAILEAWREVELTVEQIAAYEGVRVSGAPSGGPPGASLTAGFSPAVLARRLVDLKHIDSETFRIFEELRQLRNQASHAPDSQPSTADAREYIRLAFQLTERLRFLVWGMPPNDAPQQTGSAGC